MNERTNERMKERNNKGQKILPQGFRYLPLLHGQGLRIFAKVHACAVRGEVPLI